MEVLGAIQSSKAREGSALPAPTHSSERQAAQGHVHEAVIPAEGSAAGPGQHLLDHLEEAGRRLRGWPAEASWLSPGPRGSSQLPGPWKGLSSAWELKPVVGSWGVELSSSCQRAPYSGQVYCTPARLRRVLRTDSA